MSTGHTPGPWYYPGRTVATPGTITGCVGTIHQDLGRAQIIAHIAHADGDAEANARLIAAAPDMLAALERAVARCDENAPNFDGRTPECQADYDACVTAIAKARGTA